MTGVTFIPLKSENSKGFSILDKWSIPAVFHDNGQVHEESDKFQTLATRGAKISALSLQTQKGRWSDLVAILFIFDKAIRTWVTLNWGGYGVFESISSEPVGCICYQNKDFRNSRLSYQESHCLEQGWVFFFSLIRYRRFSTIYLCQHFPTWLGIFDSLRWVLIFFLSPLPAF